jgi:hypothetical protein
MLVDDYLHGHGSGWKLVPHVCDDGRREDLDYGGHRTVNAPRRGVE